MSVYLFLRLYYRLLGYFGQKMQMGFQQLMGNTPYFVAYVAFKKGHLCIMQTNTITTTYPLELLYFIMMMTQHAKHIVVI